jgi:hypothetical protein
VVRVVVGEVDEAVGNWDDEREAGVMLVTRESAMVSSCHVTMCAWNIDGRNWRAAAQTKAAALSQTHPQE